jgi:tetratricopeptide (TPR) repeat protein
MLYDVLGDAVNLAQRLESAAPVGEIYAGESTVAITKDRFEFEQVGELTLKGKSQPVTAYRLLGERRRRRAGRPAAPRVERALVGRGEELASAERVLARLREGRSSLIALTGEPGVGKSRLTEEIESHAAHRSMRWMLTRCVSYGGGLAYWPYAELLRAFAGIERTDPPETGAAALRRALRRIGASDTIPYLARMMGLPPPDDCEDVSELEPEAFRRELHGAVARWATAVARQGRLVIAIEDFHWADSSSIELTKEVVRTLERVPVALLISGRPEAAAALDEIAAQVAEDARCVVRLVALGPDHTAEMVENILGAPPPADLIPFVAERAAGNPFFIEELLRSLQDTGALYQADGLWRMEAGFDAAAVPPTVEGVLSARLDMLPQEVSTVLQVGSVIGRRVLVPLLRKVLDEQVDLDRKLDELVEGGFLAPSGAAGASGPATADVLVFHHALVQDVAYARMLRRRRRELHLKVAQAGEELYGSGDDVVDLLARHLYLGGAGIEAVDVLVRAGERARRLFANEEAILHFEHAAEVSQVDLERWPPIAMSLADLYELSGRYDKALSVFAEVRERSDDVRGWCGAAAALRVRGEYTSALDLIAQRIALGDFAVMELSQLLLEEGSTLAAAGRYREAIQSLSAGLDAAGSRRNATIGTLLLQMARAETVERELEAALAHALDAQQLFEELGDIRGMVRAHRTIAAARHLMGQLDEAAAALRKGLELAERLGAAEEMGACLINLGFVELDRGALPEAIACDRRAIEQFERIGAGAGRAIGYGNIAVKLTVVGDLDEAESYCKKALEFARSIQHSHTVADATRTLGTIRVRQGRYAEAVTLAEEAAALFNEMGVSAEASDSLKVAAEALDCVGEWERASDTRSRARELAGA